MNHRSDAVNGQISCKLLETKQHWGHEPGPGPAELGYVANSVTWLIREDFKLIREWSQVGADSPALTRASSTGTELLPWFPFPSRMEECFPKNIVRTRACWCLVELKLVPQLPWGGGGWIQRVPLHISHPSPGMPLLPVLDTLLTTAAAPGGRHWPSSSGNGDVRIPQLLVPSLLPHLAGTLGARSRRW